MIAPRGKKCSNEFLHTSIVIEKENHTRGMSLPLKVEELPRLVDRVHSRLGY
jgi:hypothetical protein